MIVLIFLSEYSKRMMLTALFSTFFLFANGGNLKVIIYDSEQKDAIIGAKVYLSENSRGVISNLNGGCNLENLQAGIYTLKTSYYAYLPQVITVTALESGTTKIEVFLERGMELKEVTVTGMRRPQYETITAIDAELRPIQSSQEMLRNVPGLFVAQHAGGGKAEQIFLRGFDIDHGTDINIKVDGMPVNMVSHAHGQGYSDLHFVIPELVEYIDFTKGPYYANQGNFSTAGAVEMSTKAQLNKSMVKLETGQFNTQRALAMVKLPLKSNQKAYVATDYSYSDGYFNSSQNFHRVNIFGKFSSQLSKNTFMNVSASTFYSQWTASGQIPERAVNQGLIPRFGAIDNTEGGKTGRTNVNAKFTHALSNNTTWEQQLFYSYYQFSLFSNFTFFLRDSINGDQIHQQEERHLAGYNSTLSHNSHFLGMPMLTELGVNLRSDFVDNVYLADTYKRKNPVYKSLGDISESNFGYFAMTTFTVLPHFSLTTGVRFDQFLFHYQDKLAGTSKNIYGQTVNPKLNLKYNLSPRISLFGMAGTGFHSNDTRVVVQEGANQTLPKALGYEGGVVLKPRDNMLINVAVWNLDLQQEFVYVGDEGIVEPGDKTRRSGVDISIRYQPLSWLTLDSDINMCKANYRNTAEAENYIPLAPTFTSTGGITLKKGRWQSSLRYRHMGDRAANEDNSLIAKGYFVSDMKIKYNFSQYEFALSVKNVFNTKWKETQFETTSRLKNESTETTEINFTPGTPRFTSLSVGYLF